MVGVGEEPKYLVRLFAIFFDRLYEINEGLEYPLDCKLNSNLLHIVFTNFVHVFTPSNESYLVLQKNSEVWLYSISV
jgi:hypothetical protein